MPSPWDRRADGHLRMSDVIKDRLENAARTLGTASPTGYVGSLIERAFPYPSADAKYANNMLSPGSVPLEPSYSEREPNVLRFTMEPVGVGASPITRRDEATREMRRLVSQLFGPDALRWFDGRSEEWRGFGSHARLGYGAWFGTAYDRDGLHASKIYYELLPSQVDALPPGLAQIVRAAGEVMPALRPIFTSIACRRQGGNQRVTLYSGAPLRLADLGPLMDRLGLGHQLPSLMQIVGLVLGGRFDLPAGSYLLALGQSPDGPELKLEVMPGGLPDMPASFFDLLDLGLAERPRELNALKRWLWAFTPDGADRPGDVSVLSVRTTPRSPARVTLYLRPVQFEIRQQQLDALTTRHTGDPSATPRWESAGPALLEPLPDARAVPVLT